LIPEVEEIDSETELDSEPPRLVAICQSEIADNQEQDPLADFTALLAQEIAILNGSVVPKLNWSTPKVSVISEVTKGRILYG
jgi:hypothetical protein